jgi:hypothetical protein
MIEYGEMLGNSKTSRSCAKDGMKIGMQGIFSRILWTQLLEQIRKMRDIGYTYIKDPVIPSHISLDEQIIAELIEAGRSLEQAKLVYQGVSESLQESLVQLVRQASTIILHKNQQHVVHITYKDTTRQIDVNTIEQTLTSHDILVLTYESLSYEIRGDYLIKLLNLYHMHTDPHIVLNDVIFIRRVFCVVARYETLSGSSDGYQMAFPSTGFQWLRDHMGVNVECFASPLNVWNQRFCSIAYDTDRYFGSLGNFFGYDASKGGGSFEANPPFVESVMEHMARKIQTILTLHQHSDIPYSFTVIVPGWDDDKCVSYQIMFNSCFCRPFTNYKLILEAKRHNYRPGMQQRAQRDEQASNVVTFVFFLQNDAGAKKWPITVDKALELRDILEKECSSISKR